MLDHIKLILSQIPLMIDKPHYKLRLLSDSDYSKILYKWNMTTAHEKDKLIHDLFAEQVKRVPNRIAIIYENKHLTYESLHYESNKLARYIRSKYKQKFGSEMVSDTLISLCVERSLDTVIGILGILKAGGAYVAIDPQCPASRMRYILNDAGCPLLLTQDHILESIESFLPESTQAILIDHTNYKDESIKDLSVCVKPTDLAYVIYTSGTTGEPKGVMQPHTNVIRLFTSTDEFFGFNLHDVWTLYHSYAFDFSVWEIWGALFYGGKLVIPSYKDTRDIPRFYSLCCKHGVSVLNQTPTAFQVLSDHIIRSKIDDLTFRYVIFGGEAFHSSQLYDWWRVFGDSNPILVNMYGVTETTVHVTYNKINECKTDHSHIGKAISDLKVYILDPYFNILPVGVTGELYVSGAGLARGYLNQPEITKEKFISNPFASSSDIKNGYTRLYKTGDLACYSQDGNIEYKGRNDRQVKIRGFRIELEEIEKVLGRYDGVEQCVIVCYEEPHPYMAAFYTCKTTNIVDKNLVMEYLCEILPEYMLPSTLIRLEQMPLTVNGKLDTSALPLPEFTGDIYTPPRDELEKNLCDIWEKSLSINKVGITDNFFRLGGDSIISIRVVAQMKMIGVNISVIDLYTYKTIKKLMDSLHEIVESSSMSSNYKPYKLIDNDTKNSVVARLSNRKDTIEDIYPASYLQMGMLFESERDVYGETYHNVSSCIIKYSFNEYKFLRVFRELTEKHPLLRTFYLQDEKYGYLSIQNKIINVADRYRIIESIDVDDFLSQESKRHIVLDEACLLTLIVLNPVENEFTLVLSRHHAIEDGWSLMGFISEFILNYANNTSVIQESLPVYPKFIEKERTAISSYEHKSFWMEYLAGYDGWDVFLNKSHYKEKNSYHLMNGNQLLDEEMGTKLISLANELGVSPDVVFLSVYILVISLLVNTEDLVIGLTMNTRLEEMGGADVFGLHLNILPLRYSVDKDNYIDMKSFILDIAKEKQKIHRYNRYPYGKIKSDFNSDNNLYFSSFNYLHFAVLEEHRESGEVVWGERIEKSSIPLIFNISRYHNEFWLELQVSNDFIDNYISNRILSYFTYYLSSLVNFSGCKNSNLLPSDYQSIIYDWNNQGHIYTKDKSFHELFVEQVKRTPNKVAVVSCEQSLTYSELNKKSNQLAHFILNHKDVHSNKLICLCLDRNLDMIIAILGVMKSGKAFVPVDSTYPEERISYIFDDTKTQIILTNKTISLTLVSILESKSVILLDDEPYKDEKSTNLNISSSIDLAYVIYTSGTTGSPKGVMITHQSFSSFILMLGKQSLLSEVINQSLCTLSLTNYTFDIFGLEYGLCLLNGGTLVLSNLVMAEKDFSNNNITLIQQTPSVWRQLLDVFSKKDLSCVTCFIGGEASDGALLKKIDKICKKVFVFYGPTETTIWSTMHVYNNESEYKLIGKPLLNEKAYILGHNSEPVPVCVVGELYLSGSSLARGYLNLDDLTEEKFIENPFATEVDRENGYSRLYKTGDLVRWLPDGNIEFMGREDTQVKIQGYRIELEEIEQALSEYSNINQCVAVANINYIIAYYIGKENIVETKLVQYLRRKLPLYMIPSSFVRLDSFPLTHSGKINRSVLSTIDVQQNVISYTTARSELEVNLCGFLQEILNVSNVALEDDFFELGGDSFSAVQFIAKINHNLNINLSLFDLFRNKTISKLVVMILDRKSQDYELIKVLTDNICGEKIIFIHPGYRGCEVYEELASELSVKFSSIGIDNYIINSDIDISLFDIAKYYIDQLRKHYDLSSSVKLVGWSLGGNIALEMACQLERKGIKNIQVFLLDSAILNKNRDNIALSRNEISEEKKNRKMELIRDGVKDENYIEGVVRSVDIVTSLILTPLSSVLMYSDIFLFKAMDCTDNIPKDNGIQIFSENKIQITPMNCDHNDIIKNSKEISKVILSVVSHT
ncbi:MAG: amino acid adenylation domain-containing protein [Legionellaceae bacterium]|nr:amino acid adenylation domain-containing protein [Legionellaceae bacterium]